MMNEEIPTELQELRTGYPTAPVENWIAGGLAGLAATLVGAGTWAAITYYTNYQIGFMAVGIGFLVGITMRKFGHGHSNAFGVLAAVLAVLGCLVGNLLSSCAFIADGAEAEGMHITMMQLLEKMSPSMAMEILQQGFSPIDALFYFLAVSAAYRNSRATEV